MKFEDVVQRSTRALQPAATAVPVGTVYYVTDEHLLERSNGTTWDSISEAGTVSHTAGALTANQLVIGNALADLKTLGTLGTTTTVLHGNAAGAPTFGAVSLTADVSGDLPFANLTQGSALSLLGVAGNATADVASIAAASDNQVMRRSGTAIAFGAIDLSQANAVTGDLAFANLAQGTALSVLGVTGNATADNASIVAGSDHQVVRRSGTAVAFGAVNLAQAAAVTGDLPFANFTPATAASKLLGRGSASGAGDFEEITLGTGLTMTATTLSASGGGGSGNLFSMLFTPGDNEAPSTAFATLDTRNGHPTLDFDGATDEEAVFTGVLPAGYAGAGLTVDTYWAFTSATTGSLRVQAAIERMDASSLDIDADSFASFNSAGGSAPGTSGQLIKVTVTFTSGAQMDSLAASEMFRLKIRRDADGTSGTDDITTDAELLSVVLKES